ncbi:ATP-dependent DNA ligase [Rhodococcus sp. MSC1_016]|jgi:bifunctional non-homologous end joining protein LigD|uniref:ATP-dependent DNA ligase n=1 Tax=Rhodococcus sp. MSC1_016 TaxID=2909266 RepID=UPI002030B981|nr:DNA ligase [Rhodococcus sp. MSC1_016]
MRLIAPMLATAGALPDDTAERPWSFEMKYDGCRMLASVGGGQEPVLWTRAMNVVTPSYPEIAEALTAAFGGRGRIVLDGEVVVLDHGRPSFGLLQRRMGIAHATKPLQRRIPVTFLPFDVLVLDDLDLTSASYLDRRAELAELDSILQDVGGLPITAPPHWENQRSTIMLNAANSAGMEGILAKRSASIYLPGQRSRSWIKHAIRTRSSVLVIGFVGSSRSVAALILGAYDAENRLIQVGSVSSGLTVPMRRQLREDFRPLERPSSPLTDPSAAAETFPGIQWLTPRLVVDVAYRAHTAGGLRHPSLKGRRFDVDFQSVRAEDL